MTAPTSPLPASTPMAGVECGRCGWPALSLERTVQGSRIVHLDPRRRPCSALLEAAA